MKIVNLLLRLINARSWQVKLSALVGLVVAISLLWHSPYQRAVSTTSVAQAGTSLSGEVVRVMDGDTLELRTADGNLQRVRLAYIDAPEHAQPYGNRAKRNLAELAQGKTVQVQSHGPDRYGRLLGDVMQNGVDVSQAQLAAGLAWHYVFYAQKTQPGDQFSAYSAAESAARANRQGLWADDDPTPPWIFRRNRRGN